MYTMVLMMAVSTGGDVSSFGFGHHRSGCNGASACHGTVVATAPAGCTGHVDAAAGCSGSCHGAKKGFLSGLFGHHKKSSCHGSSSCHGAAVAVPDCGGCPPVVYGAPVMGGTTPPVIMPKVEDPKPKPKTEDPKPKTESN